MSDLATRIAQYHAQNDAQRAASAYIDAPRTYAAKAVLMIDYETTSELHNTMAQALGDAFGSVAELGYEVRSVDTIGELVAADVYDVDGVRHGSIMIYTLRAGQR